ncbi:MAG: acylneuraminate cytidylyltransferase family protein [Candidatus Glassbacteria bacterium]
MIDGRRVLAVITARGGSKSLPRKNLRLMAGKSLLAWTVEAAQGSRLINRLVLSSEDPEIIRAAGELGCEAPFVRPRELAGDDVSAVDVVIHAIRELPGYDYVLLLQPTTPFRSASDIDNCIELCRREDAPAVISLAPVKKNPFWMFRLDEEGRLQPLIEREWENSQRQDLPEFYVINGGVYVARTDYLLEHGAFIGNRTLGYVMPEDRSLDIDTVEDLSYAEYLVSCGRGRQESDGR